MGYKEDPVFVLITPLIASIAIGGIIFAWLMAYSSGKITDMALLLNITSLVILILPIMAFIHLFRKYRK